MCFSTNAADDRHESNRVLLLMVSCVAYIALLPLRGINPHLMDALEVLVIVSAVWVCADTRRALVIAVALGLPAAVLTWLATPQELNVFSVASLLFSAALWIYVLALMLLRIVRTRVITRETLYLAVSSYMLLGFVWTMAYIVLELARHRETNEGRARIIQALVKMRFRPVLPRHWRLLCRRIALASVVYRLPMRPESTSESLCILL